MRILPKQILSPKTLLVFTIVAVGTNFCALYFLSKGSGPSLCIGACGGSGDSFPPLKDNCQHFNVTSEIDLRQTGSETPRSLLAASHDTLLGRLGVTENLELFQNTFDSKVDAILGRNDEYKEANPALFVDPHRTVLKNVRQDPLHYDRLHKEGSNECPLLLVFYYEPGTSGGADSFATYNHNLGTRCVFFFGPPLAVSSEEAETFQRKGYTVENKGGTLQDEVLRNGLAFLQETYGPSEIVTLNDLDHVLTWWANGSYYRYPSYSGAALVYALDFLQGHGSGDRELNERFAVPCTCLLEDNKRYISLEQGQSNSDAATMNIRRREGVAFSQYGVENKFFPTMIFYINDGQLNKKGQTSTVFGSLSGPLRSRAIHYLGKEKVSQATHASVLHIRHDAAGEDSKTNKYSSILSKKAVYRDDSSSIADALFCSMGRPEDILNSEGSGNRCRKVKETANILFIANQRRLCSMAGHSNEHCRNDLTCCVSLSSPERFTVGDRVEGNWQLEGEYYSGIVTARVSSGNITIQYDDDASFETLPISSVRLEYPAHAAGSGSFDFRNRTNRQKPMQ